MPTTRIIFICFILFVMSAGCSRNDSVTYVNDTDKLIFLHKGSSVKPLGEPNTLILGYDAIAVSAGYYFDNCEK